MPHLPGLTFDLGETIDMLRDTVQQFADAEIAPRAAAIDRDNVFPADLWAKLPLLATYLGHSNVLATHVYLTATADLRDRTLH
jgi:hypothetical protein